MKYVQNDNMPQRANTVKPKRVFVNDYSGSYELTSGGLRFCHGLFGRKDRGTLLASGCSLPTDNHISPRFKNDCIVKMDDGRMIFIEERFLTIDDRLAAVELNPEGARVPRET